MAKSDNSEAASSTKSKQVRVSQADVPAYSLEDALRIAHAIADNYASAPTKPLDVAAAMNLAPGSSHFRMLTGSAIAYGLTTGGYNSAEISITPLARRIVSPLEEGDDTLAKREALLIPNIIGQFLTKYNNSPLPPVQIAHNVLATMGVPRERASSVYQMIMDGAELVGLIQEIKSKRYVNLDKKIVSSAKSDNVLEPVQAVEVGDDTPSEPDTTVSTPNSEIAQPSTNNRKVFITHGRNKGLVGPIKKLLAFGELEAVVSVDRQSVSQPVPDKVMNDMRECGAAIIHVEGEMTLLDSEAKEHVVLNPNVLIEIGAAMALYGKKFILLVREGVKLPSNLQGLYEVRYEGDSMDGNSTIRLLEAINHLKSQSR